MAIKQLQGVRVTPRGNRFQSQNWPQSYAFGGWIYNTNGDINFGDSPSEITMSIALGNLGEDNVTDFSNQPITFDIDKTDLKLGTDTNGQESLFDININGAQFNDYVLFAYDIDIQDNQKILNVVFKDYSVILDKIYIGLVKREGAKNIHRVNISGLFPTKCPDCQFSGDSFVHDGILSREIDLGSYAGLNGQIYDNMADVEAILNQQPLLERNAYDYWNQLSILSNDPSTRSNSWEDNFNLNGGYLIIGTEDIPQENCGSLPDVNYSFPELLASLRYRGLNFTGEFPTGNTTQSHYYKKNYNGTLREVLRNWGSDFGIDFFASGKTFWGMDITNPIQLSGLTGIVDPTTVNGLKFDFPEDNAISSYKESYSLDNTYDQAVVTYDVKPAQIQKDSKTVERYVGYVPLHPMDLNYVNRVSLTLMDNAFGQQFITNTPFFDFEECNSTANEITQVYCGSNLLAVLNHGADRYRRFDKWTNRTFGDMDTSMALAKYNESLRNIYVGGRIISSLETIDPLRNGSYNIINASAKNDLDANFMALGFHPIARVLETTIKTQIIQKFKTSNGTAIDQKFFEVYIGYYFPEEHQAVVQVEKSMAENMYKYGLLTQGVVNDTPYTIEDYFYNLSPEAGLSYGESGIKRTTYTHSYSPETEQYPVVEDAPFKDAVPFYTWSNSSRFTGVYYGNLDNLWGTTPDEFNRSIEFEDDQCQNYSSQRSAQELIDPANRGASTKQTWDMNFFTPSFHSELDSFYGAISPILESLAATNQLGVDQVSVGFWNYNGEYTLGCRKLHVAIIPITQNNPNSTYSCHANGRFTFTPSCESKIRNKEMFMKYQEEYIDEQKELQSRPIDSICDVSISEELCANALEASGQAVRGSSYDCTIALNEDLVKFDCVTTGIPTRKGFHPSWIEQPNSRYLSINIERNPAALTDATFVPTDSNGDYYIDQVNVPEALQNYNYAQLNPIIVYPVSTPYDQDGSTYGNYEEGGRLYYGIMSTKVETEIRTPETIEIYGEPVNKINSNASEFKLISNKVNPDLDPFLNASNNSFVSYLSLITGNSPSSVISIQEYHNIISNLNNYNSPAATEKIDIEILGEATGISHIVTPLSGLTSFSVSLGQDGLSTNLSFSSKPPTLPAQETILNKINSRIIK